MTAVDQLIQDRFEEHIIAVRASLSVVQASLAKAATLMATAAMGRKPILIFGNGGSAADALHWAGELAGRFKMNRPALNVQALTGHMGTITAVANDFGYEEVFARQVEAYAEPGGVAWGVTTSNSKNVMRGLSAAGLLGMRTVAFLSSRSRITVTPTVSVVVPSADTARIQEIHHLCGHILCEWIERQAAK